MRSGISLCGSASSFAQRWLRFLLVLTLGYSGAASAILIDRGPDLVYDTVLDMTWTRQAGDGALRTWPNSVAWADGLSFAGFDDWRLPWASVAAGTGPTASVADCAVVTEAQCRDNEMGYMFYYNLGGDLLDDKTGTQTAVGGEMLTGIQSVYWSGTALVVGPAASQAWFFAFSSGEQNALPGEDFELWAWAVRPGDVIPAVAVIPEPSTYALMLVGLGIVGFVAKRRRKGPAVAH